MKSTGVVRRIDDLGRIVIPKEIRKILRIKEGDPVEVFTDKEGEIILKKYSPIGELTEFAEGYAETLSKTTGHIAFITDKDTIIAVSGGSKKEYLEKQVFHVSFSDVPQNLNTRIFRWRCVWGKHPYPSRTRWLSPKRPMVLHWRRCGRVGGCRIPKRKKPKGFLYRYAGFTSD